MRCVSGTHQQSSEACSVLSSGGNVSSELSI